MHFFSHRLTIKENQSMTDSTENKIRIDGVEYKMSDLSDNTKQ